MAREVVGPDRVGDGIWKYVIHGDGTALFAEFSLSGQCPTHFEIRRPGSIAVSAGILGRNGPDLVVASATSETLGIHGSVDRDLEVLRKLIGGVK